MGGGRLYPSPPGGYASFPTFHCTRPISGLVLGSKGSFVVWGHVFQDGLPGYTEGSCAGAPESRTLTQPRRPPPFLVVGPGVLVPLVVDSSIAPCCFNTADRHACPAAIS